MTVNQASSSAGMSGSMGNMGSMSGMGNMSPAATSALVFLPAWVAMMVAMMFPAVAPVVSLFGAASRKQREAGRDFVPVPVFLAGYLVIWTLFGAGAFALSRAVPSVDMMAPGLHSVNPVAAGLVLAFAGLYEWSPLKRMCLRHCRSPLGLFMKLWRPGWIGALRMGAIHGAYCLGCCWGLMLVLFAVGLMNLLAMVLLSIVIFAEKVLPRGQLFGTIAGVVLVAGGVFELTAPIR